jgi:hypothetical protein
MTAAERDNGPQALAALALVRAYTERDLYTARHILAAWDTGDRASSFAAIVASAAATLLERVAGGDRDKAERWADEALAVYQGIRADKLVA